MSAPVAPGPPSRLSWVEGAVGTPASRLTWVVALVSCTVAVIGYLGDVPAAAGAVLVLLTGAVLGRVLHLELMFRASPSWMWSIGVGTALFVAGTAGWGSPLLGQAAGLFLLALDWRIAARVRAAVGAGLVFAMLAVVSAAGWRGWTFAAWAPLAALTLLLVERDTVRAGRQAAQHRPPGLPPVPQRRSPAWRDAVLLGAVGTTAALLAVVLLPPPTPAPAPGRQGDPGPSDRGYWGFDNQLDTGTRGARTDEVVLRVRAESPALWRGDSYDEFDGRRWTHRVDVARPIGAGGRITVPESPALAPPDPAGAAADGPPVSVPSDEQVQVFTFERGGNDLVFGANRPTAVLAPGDGGIWNAGSDAVRLDQPVGRGGSYTVISNRPRIDAELLRSLDARQAEALRSVNRRSGRGTRFGALPFDRFLTVPGSTTDRTRALAREVTAASATTYDKIQALTAWLGANTAYRLDIPALPAGRDAVDQYLFEDRQGYCEQIASALAVMLRTLGVPTRLAVGYVPERLDPATGQYVVLDRNAHAWVEVWWPDVGWQGFDPTADVPLAPDAGTSTVSERFSLVWPAVAGTALLLAAAVGGTVAVARWSARRRRAGRSWLVVAVGRLDAVGARIGHPRRADRTLREYGDELAATGLADPPAPGPTDGNVPAVVAALTRAAFAGDESDEVTRRAVDRHLDVLEQRARRLQREQRRARRRGRSRSGADPAAPDRADPSAEDTPQPVG